MYIILFTVENLQFNSIQLFMAGSDSLSATMRWGLLYLALNDSVQDKVHKEIDEVIGLNA